MNVELIKKYAVDKLLLSLKYNKFDEYVLGDPIYGVRTKNMNGIEEDCVFAKMEAIYNYHKKNMEAGIDKKLYDILLKYVPIVKGDEAIISILRTIEYQIIAEKEKRAPFIMDNQTLLMELKKNLSRNKELYQSERYQRRNFWNTIQQHDESLSSNYGHKIL